MRIKDCNIILGYIGADIEPYIIYDKNNKIKTTGFYYILSDSMAVTMLYCVENVLKTTDFNINHYDYRIILLKTLYKKLSDRLLESFTNKHTTTKSYELQSKKLSLQLRSALENKIFYGILFEETRSVLAQSLTEIYGKKVNPKIITESLEQFKNIENFRWYIPNDEDHFLNTSFHIQSSGNLDNFFNGLPFFQELRLVFS